MVIRNNSRGIIINVLCTLMNDYENMSCLLQSHVLTQYCDLAFSGIACIIKKLHCVHLQFVYIF